MDFTNNSISIYEYQTLLTRLEKAEDKAIHLIAHLLEAEKLLKDCIPYDVGIPIFDSILKYFEDRKTWEKTCL
jgi:hypothetical protein